MAFTKHFTLRIFCKCKCHCEVWRMIDSLYYSSRKIPERCENSFVNYRINYQKLYYSLRRIWTQPPYDQAGCSTCSLCGCWMHFASVLALYAAFSLSIYIASGSRFILYHIEDWFLFEIVKSNLYLIDHLVVFDSNFTYDFPSFHKSSVTFQSL